MKTLEMKILGISGSLRAGSFNTAVLRDMEARLPDGVTFEMADIASLPHYNEEIDGENSPASVVAFKAAVAEASALLIATPEYNYSVPGVLKNAIDWASRPAFNSVLKDKVVGIVSASMAFTGGVRAQQHLKTILGGTLSRVILMPEVLVPAAHTQIAEGRLTDEATRQYLDKLRDALLAAAGETKPVVMR